MQRRVQSREPGMLQDVFVARVLALESILDEVQLEDFSLSNDEASITSVARELLVRAGWLI